MFLDQKYLGDTSTIRWDSFLSQSLNTIISALPLNANGKRIQTKIPRDCKHGSTPPHRVNVENAANELVGWAGVVLGTTYRQTHTWKIGCLKAGSKRNKEQNIKEASNFHFRAV